jgi:hypothetical protein
VIDKVASREFPGIVRGWMFQHVLACLGLLPKAFIESKDYDGGYN